MAKTSQSAWGLAEKRCFEYLLDKLDGTEGQNAFIAILPPLSDVWMFEINGGPVPDQSWGGEVGTAWRMNALFQTRCNEREDAQALGGLVREWVQPARTNNYVISGVQVFRRTGEPTLEPDVLKIMNDTEDQLYWLLTQPLEVVFNNQTE